MNSQSPTLPQTCAATARYLAACGEVITAHKGAPMASSAALCLSDAETLADSYDHHAAKRRALYGVAYAVGVAHPTYQRLAEQIGAYR